jgi:hypothetical protein
MANLLISLTKVKGESASGLPFSHFLWSPTLYKLLPRLVFFQVSAEEVTARGARLVGALQQPHVGLSERAAALPVVAGRARAHQVFPMVLSPIVAWEDVIHGQVLCLLAAILAGVVISPEDLFLGELHPGARPPDQVDQLYHRGAQESSGRGVDDPSAVLQNVGLAHHDQGDSPLDVADVQRFVV